MQEIVYEDGEKTKKLFESFFEALDDTKRKALQKPIKKVTITTTIPGKRREKHGQNQEKED